MPGFPKRDENSSVITRHLGSGNKGVEYQGSEGWVRDQQILMVQAVPDGLLKNVPLLRSE